MMLTCGLFIRSFEPDALVLTEVRNTYTLPVLGVTNVKILSSNPTQTKSLHHQPRINNMSGHMEEIEQMCEIPEFTSHAVAFPLHLYAVNIRLCAFVKIYVKANDFAVVFRCVRKSTVLTDFIINRRFIITRNDNVDDR